MNMKNSQRGFTFWTLSFVLLVIGFVVFNVLKLMPVYTDEFAVETAVTSLESDRAESYTGAMSVKQALLKRLYMSNVTNVKSDDISVVREYQTYKVDVDYEVRLPYIKNINLLITFKHHAEVPAN